MATSSVSLVWSYFKSTYDNIAQFRRDWRELTDKDRADLLTGITDGSLTY